MKSKPRRSPKGRAKTKHGAVRKKKHDDLHPKPHECRQQIVDAFSKKMPRLPRGEMGFLLVLPADRRGPARIKHHNMTGSQVVATVQGLCSSLPSQMPHHKQRLDNWISHLKAQRKCKKTSKRRKRPGECFIVIWLAQSQSHWNLQQTVDSLVRIQVPLQPPLVLTQTCMHCLLYGAERSSSSTDGSEVNAETVMLLTKEQQALRRRHAAARTVQPLRSTARRAARPVTTARAVGTVTAARSSAWTARTQLPLQVIFLASKLAGVLTAKATAHQEGSKTAISTSGQR